MRTLHAIWEGVMLQEKTLGDKTKMYWSDPFNTHIPYQHCRNLQHLSYATWQTSQRDIGSMLRQIHHAILPERAEILTSGAALTGACARLSALGDTESTSTATLALALADTASELCLLADHLAHSAGEGTRHERGAEGIRRIHTSAGRRTGEERRPRPREYNEALP